MLEVLREPDCTGQPAGDTSSPHKGDTVTGAQHHGRALKDGAGFSTTCTEDQKHGDPAVPPHSCVQGRAAACSVPTDRASSGSRPGCGTSPGSSRAILKGTRDFPVLGSGRAGAICGQNKGVPSLTVLPHRRGTGTRASREPCSTWPLVLAVVPASPTRPLGSVRFPAIGGTCPPGRRTARSFPQAQAPLVPWGRPWSLWPEPLTRKARPPVAGLLVLVLGSGCPHRAPHSPPHTWWSPTTYET